MTEKHILVETNEQAMVPCPHSLKSGVRRFINRTLKNGVWEKNKEPSEVLPCAEISYHIKCGDLILVVAIKEQPLKQQKTEKSDK